MPIKEFFAEKIRVLTADELERAGLVKERKYSPEKAASRLLVNFHNLENGNNDKVEINFEGKIIEFKDLYKNVFNLDIDENEIRGIWNKNYETIKKEIETYGYDTILIVPDNLPAEEIVNQKMIETMDEGAGKGTVVSTIYWVDQNNLKSAGEQKCRIVLVHSDQNIYANSAANPYLKATLNKNIPQLVFNMSQEEWKKLDDEEKKKKAQESFQKLKAGANVDFETNINGQDVRIQAEGMSLEEYEIFQRIYFEKINPGNHLDANGWTWLPKSFSGSSVVSSFWYPGARQLAVNADDPSGRNGNLGLRLSRSFSN